jgi:hypothetical protein
MKNNLIYFIFYLLFLFTACSKEETENIKPITDLPCEQQGTYFLSATIGDSVLCYASDSAFDDRYSFLGSLRPLLDNYGKDTSGILVQIQKYENDTDKKGIFQFTIPIRSHYELRPYITGFAAFYDRLSLEESLNNKIYTSKSYRTNSFERDFNFSVRHSPNRFSDIESSYYGNQDSSYIHLIYSKHLYDRKINDSIYSATYNITYQFQSNLYDGASNYLYSIRAEGTFRTSFFLLN